MKLHYVAILAALLVAMLLLTRQEVKQPEPVKEKAPEKVAETPKESKPTFAVSCKHLSEMLATCQPYTCETPHPQARELMVKHTVAGALPNGLCIHLQTAPNDMLVVCNYSSEMRLLVAKNLRPEAQGKMTDEEDKILSAGFDAECEVVNTRTGEVMKRTLGGDRMEDKTDATQNLP